MVLKKELELFIVEQKNYCEGRKGNTEGGVGINTLGLREYRHMRRLRMKKERKVYMELCL